MTEAELAEIEKILTEADALIRRRFRKRAVCADHVILAVGLDGAGIIRSSVPPEFLVS